METKGADDVDDDDSENDSDYCPENDKDALEADEDPVEEEKLAAIPQGRKRKVDDLWAAMQEESKAPTTKQSTAANGCSRKSSKNKSTSKKTRDILASIFGKKESKNILGGATKREAASSDELLIREAARESVKALQKKTTVTETRKFAGQEITIERVVKGQAPNDGTSKFNSCGKNKITALDGVLDSIKGPKTVSTVAKSNYDWETYKEKEGLEDELSAAAKDGFLTRKDFLQRCDYRAYEQERDDRLLKSAQTSNSK